MSDYSYMVEYAGQSRKLKPGQMTRTILALLFRLVADTIVLVSDEGHVEVADDEGAFTQVDPFLIWTCIGDKSSLRSTVDLSSGHQVGSSSSCYDVWRGTSSNSPSWKPKFRAASCKDKNHHRPPTSSRKTNETLATHQSDSNESWTKYVRRHMLYQERTGNEATVKPHQIDRTSRQDVASIVSTESFGGEQVRLLDANNYPISSESEGTKGERVIALDSCKTLQHTVVACTVAYFLIVD